MSQNVGNMWPQSRAKRRKLAEYWWMNGIPKEEDVSPETLVGLLYRHPISDEMPGILIQWYDGRKPRSQPAWFFETDMRPLRRDMQNGWRVFVRKPDQTLVPLTRHMQYQEVFDLVGAKAPR